jgi:adhesin transport system membrane fusion protein
MRDRRPISASRKVIFLTAAAIAGFIGWASIAEIDQVSRATGQVIPSGRVQIVQTTDGGVIEAINVKEGDRVKAGQILVTLDRIRLAAAVDEGRAKVASLKTVKARIEAELFQRPLVFSDDVKDFRDFMANQQQLFLRRRAAQTEDITALKGMLRLVRQELAMNQPLLEYGDVSLSEILRLERSVADIDAQIANKQNRYLQELQTEYAKVEEELVTAEQTLTQRLSALADTEIVAPTNGIVKNVRLTTLGGVLRPSDEVLQIVPTGKELIVEAKVLPSDIAYVRLGQRASTKFDAYDPSIFGSADGSVIYVSPDTLSEQSQSGERVYYRVHIRVDTKTMRRQADKDISIQPGMTATVEILTGKNTVLKYLLKPIIRTIEKSFGER